MPFSLLEQPWLPVRRASGPAWIRPAQIAESLDSDPVLIVDWPRADFRLASLEFLIGLLATTCPPESKGDWLRRYREPPSPEALDEAFAPLAHAFYLDGPGPRFMQDFEEITGEPNDIAGLLIEAPGEQTLKRNADLLVKRGRVRCLSRAAAAMTLFTLQTYAPAGGAGNRTGLRGGGPLTTLAIPPHDGPLPLWRQLWANVPVGEPAETRDLPRIMPWFAPTRSSETGRTISQEGDYDLLAFWAMPRRIRLGFRAAEGDERCDLTGIVDHRLACSWRQRPYGANYQSFEHPLSPHYRPKPKEQTKLPVHPQPGGIGYRHFLGLLAGSAADIPAACIVGFGKDRLRDSAPSGNRNWRILAAGFDMDNMKARSFIETELPVFEPEDPARRDACIEQVKLLVLGAREAADLLRRAVRLALFSEGAKPALNAALFTSLRARFWAETEDHFYAAARRVAAGEERETVASGFLKAIGEVMRHLFSEAAPILGADHPERIAGAARILGIALNGYGKQGVSLFGAFGLPPPKAKPKAKGKAA